MDEPQASPVSASPVRAPRDRQAIVACVASALAIIACVPVLSLPLAVLGGCLGLTARQRARRSGGRTTLATVAIGLAAASVAAQWALSSVSTGWLMPTMERRMVAAITAACEGRPDDAVPETAEYGFAHALPAPSSEAIRSFADRLRTARGGLRSVSLVNREVAGSPIAPTIIAALVLDFEHGAATGSARMQWLPADPSGEAQWLPKVRLLELEISLADGASLMLSGDPSPDPSATPRPSP